MAIEDTLIYKEVLDVLNSTPQVPYHLWSCEIYVKGKALPFYGLVNRDIVRSYEVNAGDDVRLTLRIPAGDYFSTIIPNKNNLEIAIYRKPANDGAVGVSLSHRYRAFLSEVPTASVQGGTPGNMDFSGANLAQMLDIKFELKDFIVEQLTMASIRHCIARNQVPGDVLKFLLTKESQAIPVPQEVGFLGVDMYPPSNTEKTEHVNIKAGTEVLDLYWYIQRYCNGIYTTGICSYFQDRYWYVYPKGDTERFFKSKRTLTVVVVPENKMPHVEKTFKQTDSQLVVLSTGGVKHTDDTEAMLSTAGTGTRFMDGKNVLAKEPGEFNNGKYLISRGTNISEVSGIDRDTKLQNVRTDDIGISSNSCEMYSKIALRLTSILSFVWHNADETLIYPGMPVKVVYENNGDVKEGYGVVCGAHYFTTPNGNTVIGATHSTNATVSVRLKK